MNDPVSKNNQLLFGKAVSFKGMAALVVDNVVNMRMTMVSMLNDLGFGKVFHANNGLEALELLSSEKIDVVLSEYHLPKMDGITLLKKLRSESKTEQLPFIMTSATIAQSEVVSAIKSGVSEYVVKPFSAKILTERVHRALINPVKYKTPQVSADEKPVTEHHQPDQLRILIVDDVPDNIQLLMELLKKDYVLKAAINGETALKICALDPQPDIVLLDIMMPELDGLEICRRLKTDAKTQHITVIFITALDQADDIVKGFELGAVDYITKPFNPAVVKARLQTHSRLLRSQQMALDQVDQLMDNARQKEKFEQILQNDLKVQLAEIFQSLHQLDRNIRDSARVKSSASVIHATTARLDRMIDNMLALSRIEEGSYRFVPEHFSLPRQVAEVIELFQSSAKEKNLEVQFNPDRDYAVTGELFLTASVVSNLYKNALEAAPRGSVIRFLITKEGPWVKLCIKNQGLIPEVIQPIFFDKYITHGKKNGNGIGSYAAKLMTEVQQGKLEFECDPEQGTSLMLYMKPSPLR